MMDTKVNKERTNPKKCVKVHTQLGKRNSLLFMALFLLLGLEARLVKSHVTCTVPWKGQPRAVGHGP